LVVSAKKDRIIMFFIRLPRGLALWDSETLSHWALFVHFEPSLDFSRDGEGFD